jgi:hypothetical protein
MRSLLEKKNILPLRKPAKLLSFQENLVSSTHFSHHLPFNSCSCIPGLRRNDEQMHLDALLIYKMNALPGGMLTDREKIRSSEFRDIGVVDL